MLQKMRGFAEMNKANQELSLVLLNCVLDWLITFCSCVTTAMLATQSMELPHKGVLFFAAGSATLMAARTAKQIVEAHLKGFKNAVAEAVVTDTRNEAIRTGQDRNP